MTASPKEIRAVSKAAREILDKKGSVMGYSISSMVKDEELNSWSEYFIDTLDWYRASDKEPKVPSVAPLKEPR